VTTPQERDSGRLCRASSTATPRATAGAESARRRTYRLRPRQARLNRSQPRSWRHSSPLAPTARGRCRRQPRAHPRQCADPPIVTSRSIGRRSFAPLSRPRPRCADNSASIECSLSTPTACRELTSSLGSGAGVRLTIKIPGHHDDVVGLLGRDDFARYLRPSVIATAKVCNGAEEWALECSHTDATATMSRHGPGEFPRRFLVGPIPPPAVRPSAKRRTWLSVSAEEPRYGLGRLQRSRNEGKRMWLALASATLTAAIGFNGLALAIHDRNH
jgi:hypothetical protein